MSGLTIAPRLTVFTLGVIVGVVACNPDVSVDPVPASKRAVHALRSQSASSGWRTLDERYADLADSVPGFGGLFYDTAGRLTMYAKEPAAFNGRSRQRLVSFLRAQRGGRAMPGDEDLQVLRGRYDFRELLGFYRNTVIPVIPSIEGVTTSDIDEVRHRIVIGVSDPSFVGRARQRIDAVGLPNGLVDVDVVAPAHPDASLSDYLRPVPGGARITTNGGCVLGYSLIRYVGSPMDTAATARYFVTNSHCTTTRNVLDGVTATQGGGSIGAEIGDPAVFNNSYTPACPAGYACRWADAALFEYGNPADADQGRVAFPNLNSTSFTTYLTVTSVQSPTAGYTVNMIGASSGRRSGTVLGTCVDVWGITGWANGRLLCQGKASYTSVDGDSGAPVVTAFGDGTAWATGLNWGHNATNAWFSSMDAVLNEFYLRLPNSPYLSPVVYP